MAHIAHKREGEPRRHLPVRRAGHADGQLRRRRGSGPLESPHMGERCEGERFYFFVPSYSNAIERRSNGSMIPPNMEGMKTRNQIFKSTHVDCMSATDLDAYTNHFQRKGQRSILVLVRDGEEEITCIHVFSAERSISAERRSRFGSMELWWLPTDLSRKEVVSRF